MKVKASRIIFVGLTLAVFFFAIKTFLNSVYVFPVLMYHSIDRNASGSKITVSPEEFAAQMGFLKNNGFRVVSLKEAVDLIKTNKKLPRKTVAITFDDGYENNYIYAYPVLKKHAFPATIFVIAGSLDKEGYLNTAQLKEMTDNGIEIGSHTISHLWLPGVKDAELEIEIYESKKMLTEILGREVRFFCYPVGGFDEKIKSMVGAAGYLGACTTSPGRSLPNRDIFALKRVRISGGRNNLLVFRLKISGYHTWIKERRDED